MSEPAEDCTEVLAGTAEGGLAWSVQCWWNRLQPGSEPDLMTMLRVSRGDEVLVPGSGFGGPPLWPGQIMNEWLGRTDDLPFFVMARVIPAVTRVVAITGRGAEVELALSEPFEEFGGLKFAAAAVPPGHEPASIKAEQNGTERAARACRLPPWPPGRRPS